MELVVSIVISIIISPVYSPEAIFGYGLAYPSSKNVLTPFIGVFLLWVILRFSTGIVLVELETLVNIPEFFCSVKVIGYEFGFFTENIFSPFT